MLKHQKQTRFFFGANDSAEWGRGFGGSRRFKFTWPGGPLRSFLTNLEDYGIFCLSDDLQKSHGVKEMPLELVPTHRQEQPYLFYITMEPLHHLLGK